MGGIRLEFELPAPPDQVWPLLVNREHLSVWLAENDFAPEVGRRFMIWPGSDLDLDGPISAVLLELAEPHKLLMGWQSPHTQTSMTWTLQGHRNGTRLRVTEWGHLGPNEIGRERTLNRVFGIALLAQVQRQAAVPLGAERSAAPVVNTRAPVPEPSITPQLNSATLAPGDDPTVESRRRRRAVWVGLIALLLLAAVGLYFALPVTPAKTVIPSPTGQGGLGQAPGTGNGGTGNAPADAVNAPGGGNSSGPTAGPSDLPASVTPGAIGSIGPSATSGPAATFRAGYTFSGTLSAVVTVTVTNTAATAGAWRAVAVQLGGGNLLISNISPGYNHVAHAPTHCFYPTAAVASLAPAEAKSFSFKVALQLGGLLSGDPVKNVAIDAMPC